MTGRTRDRPRQAEFESYSCIFVAPTNLLVDITIGWTPAMDFVVASNAINGWLRVDSQESQVIQLGQLRGDDGGL